MCVSLIILNLYYTILDTLSSIFGFLEWIRVVVEYLYLKTFLHFPPGPLPSPFYGNVKEFGDVPLTYLNKLKERYGPIASLHLGYNRAVVISRQDYIRSLSYNYPINGRPRLCGFDDGRLYHGVLRTGILANEGLSFDIHKTFADQVLNNLREEKIIEKLINYEVGGLIQDLRANRHGLFSTKSNIFTPSITNILWSILFGARFGLNDPDQTELMEAVSKYITESGRVSSHMFHPWIIRGRRRRNKCDAFSEHRKNFKSLKSIMEVKYDFYFKKWTEGSSVIRDMPKCFMKAYLERLGSREVDHITGKANMVSCCTDFFIMGSETVIASLNWAILFLVLHPEVQEKMFEEIAKILGQDPPNSSQMERFHYTQAVISEVLRCSSVVPIAPPHRATRDLVFQDYTIPYDTIIILNLFACNNDVGNWSQGEKQDQCRSRDQGKDPKLFYPDRFLVPSDAKKMSKTESNDASTRVYLEPHALLPFSAGRRSCTGEHLTKEQLFLFLVTLVQNFKFLEHPKFSRKKLSDCRNCDQNVLVMAPKPFMFKAESRSSS